MYRPILLVSKHESRFVTKLLRTKLPNVSKGPFFLTAFLSFLRKDLQCCGLDLDLRTLSGTNDRCAKRTLSFERVLAY